MTERLNHLQYTPDLTTLEGQAKYYEGLNQTSTGFVGPFPFAISGCKDHETAPPENIPPLHQILSHLGEENVSTFVDTVDKMITAQSHHYNEFINPQEKKASWNIARSAYQKLIGQIGNWEKFLLLSQEMEQTSIWLHAVLAERYKLPKESGINVNDKVPSTPLPETFSPTTKVTAATSPDR